jgi:hypothetical protein
MSRATLRNDATGECVPLAEIAAGTVANPVIRRGELMTRIRGCEEWAKGQGAVAEFWTITAPSRFHAQRMSGTVSERNPAYKGATPDDAQDYLCTVWARARAAFKRRGLVVYGLRVAEPHHDATPHWHVLVFGSPYAVRFARRLMRVYALRDSPDEFGARKHRFVSDAIDPKKGDAAGYVAKYVAKNIDGFGVDLDDETGKKASLMVRRCDAWASAWRIRQFQFFGVPAVGVWRELRKVRDPVKVPEIETARVAADDGDFCAYINAVGGCACLRADLRVWAVRVDTEKLTEYGDKAAAVVVAVGSVGGDLPLEKGLFVIVWGGFCSTRTRVNNCTPSVSNALGGVIDLWEGSRDCSGVGSFELPF